MQRLLSEMCQNLRFYVSLCYYHLIYSGVTPVCTDMAMVIIWLHIQPQCPIVPHIYSGSGEQRFAKESRVGISTAAA